MATAAVLVHHFFFNPERIERSQNQTGLRECG